MATIPDLCLNNPVDVTLHFGQLVIPTPPLLSFPYSTGGLSGLSGHFTAQLNLSFAFLVVFGIKAAMKCKTIFTKVTPA